MDPVIVIPARMASTRLPGKPLAMISGLPMIVHVMRRAQEAGIGPVLVAAAEEEIVKAVEMAGGFAVLTDPDHPSGTDRIREALRHFDPRGKHDIIINVQGDLPTLDPRLIREALLPFKDRSVDITTLAAEITREEEKTNPNVVKAVVAWKEGGHTGRALYFTRATAPSQEGALYHHIGLYAYRRKVLDKFVQLPPSPLEKRERLEQLRALEAGMHIEVVKVDTVPLGVDTPEELKRAEEMMESTSSAPLKKTYDLVGIGHAIVDILAYQDEAFLQKHGLTHGAMTLTGEEESAKLYKAMGATTECSGGAAANTIAGYAMLGGKAAFLGRVKQDALGQSFAKSLEKAGADFAAAPAEYGIPTGRCLILVTEHSAAPGGKPKIERTMATYLGASREMGPEDINPLLIRHAKVLFFEGYVWDSPAVRAAAMKAIRIAEEHDTKIAFSLSDPLCVGRHKQEFLDLIHNHVDILFANEHEIEALYGEKEMQNILFRVNGVCEVVAITQSEQGSCILAENRIHRIAPVKVEEVYDVTGAGDLYAAGVLYGLMNGLGYDRAGKLGSLCAAEVIKYLGGRPLSKLSALVERV